MIEIRKQSMEKPMDKLNAVLRDNAPILIIGGGIGGVATALALGQQGRRVQLFEQANQIGAIGYGVQMGPNVMPMLERLGVGDAVRSVAYFPEEILLYDLITGDKLSDIPLRTTGFRSRYAGWPYIAIHRVDLHELLLAACKKFPSIEMMPDTTVTGYRSTDGGAEISTQHKEKFSGAAIVAADGLRSRLRAQMHPEDDPCDTGYAAHRTIVPTDQAPQSMRRRQGVTMWTGPGFHVIYYPLRNRSEVNIVVVVKVPAALHATDNQGYRNHIQQLIKDTQDEPKEAVALVNLERRWSIADRNPVRRWNDGNVILVGDAAHATLQSLAQGAGMAVEDALVLADLVQKNGVNYSEAFRQFRSQRFLRTARVQLESRALWQQFHCGGYEAEVRSQQFKERSVEDYYRCLDWLWMPRPHNPETNQ